MTSFAGGAAQAGYMARVRDLAPQQCLVVAIDVGKHAAMALVADHYGQIVGEPVEFTLTVSGVERFVATVAAAERQTSAGSVRVEVQATRLRATVGSVLESKAGADVRLIKIERTSTGYLLDPNAYLDWLDASSEPLPVGASAFAHDPDHYNTHSERCVKDLKLDKITLVDREDRLFIETLFEPNKFKQDRELAIRYMNVVQFSVDVSSAARTTNVWPETRRLGDFQLDEIFPHENGCSHEIQMTGGRIWIVCEDLIAEWRRIGDGI